MGSRLPVNASLQELRERIEPRVQQISGWLRDARPDALRKQPVASLADAFGAGFAAGRIVRRIRR